MGRVSIWTVEGRQEQIGLKVSPKRLDILRAKRTRQLKREIEKAPNMRVKRRLESKLQHAG